MGSAGPIDQAGDVSARSAGPRLVAGGSGDGRLPMTGLAAPPLGEAVLPVGGQEPDIGGQT
jgi:hypothetical protein